MNSQAYIAFGRLLAVLIVSVAAVLGWKFDANLILNIILSALGVYGMARELWWTNNNVTKAAQEAQLLLNEIKEKNKNEDVD